MEPSPLPPLAEWDVCVGLVAGVHGLRGEVRVRSLSEAPDRFAVGSQVCLVRPEGARDLLTIATCRPHAGRLLVRFAGVESCEDAVALRGASLTIPRSMRQELPPGRYYYDDLIGLSVRTCDGRNLGIIQDILESPAHDIFVTEQGLIPGSREIVREVDLERRVIVVADSVGVEG